jgi:phosphatidylglycerophosphate synthase
MDKMIFPPARCRTSAASVLAAGAAVPTALTGVLLAGGRIDVPAMTAALAIYSLVAFLALCGHGGGAFGWANTVTILRAGLISVLPALVLSAERFDGWTSSAVAGFGLLALALDGVDGFIARRCGEASAFGARFDMEIDAAYVLFLSALAAATGRAGAWILLAGLMRYLWAAAAWAWPALRAPLPPSLFRKSVCVVVLLLLLLALAPFIPAALAPLPCAAALALLLVSFGRDLVWLIRGAGMAAAGIRRDGVLYEGLPRVESE